MMGLLSNGFRCEQINKCLCFSFMESMIALLSFKEQIYAAIVILLDDMYIVFIHS